MSRVSEALRVLRVIAGGRPFGLEVSAVQGVERPVRWTRLPGAPEYVRGVVEMRGQAVPVIDLGVRIGLRGALPIWPDQGVVLIDSDEPVGLAVEQIVGVEELGPGSLERIPEGAAAGVRGRARDGLLVLEAEALVDGRPLVAVEPA